MAHTTGPVFFALTPQPLAPLLAQGLNVEQGRIGQRRFPDGEAYLRVESDVHNRHCLILAELSDPDDKYLPLIFLAETLRELGAANVGLVAPYLSYMRQDKRFHEGEAVTSRIFARELSRHFDWLVTVDPHLHRYASLDEIYSIPNQVVQAEPVLTRWLGEQENVILVGPDAESEQWVAGIAERSGHRYVIGTKERRGDRDVVVTLSDLGDCRDSHAVIVDDVISSGHTLLQCIDALQAQGLQTISCAAVHGVFADHSDRLLIRKGIRQLITTNTIPHHGEQLDVSELLIAPIRRLLEGENVE